jgi:hypothetical protein
VIDRDPTRRHLRLHVGSSAVSDFISLEIRHSNAYTFCSVKEVHIFFASLYYAQTSIHWNFQFSKLGCQVVDKKLIFVKFLAFLAHKFEEALDIAMGTFAASSLPFFVVIRTLIVRVYLT